MSALVHEQADEIVAHYVLTVDAAVVDEPVAAHIHHEAAVPAVPEWAHEFDVWERWAAGACALALAALGVWALGRMAGLW